MGTASFFCSPKNSSTPRQDRARKTLRQGLARGISGFLLLSLLISCSDLKTRQDVANESTKPVPRPPPALLPSSPSNNSITSAEVAPIPTPVPTPAPSGPVDALPSQSSVRVGLILGPGGGKALAHIGVVQELLKAKVPIQSIVGIEMGALIGAVFAQKAQPFDADWQFGKVKDFRDLGGFTRTVFGNSTFDDLKINFACSSVNLKNGLATLSNRGPVATALPPCFVAPPLSRPQGHHVADLAGLKKSIDYLRSKGIGYIVYVDVLSAKDGALVGDIDDSENVYWMEMARTLKLEAQGADMVIQVPTHDYDMRDWNHRRELVKIGVDAGTKSASDILRKLGL